jgi:hypothetical protein
MSGKIKNKTIFSIMQPIAENNFGDFYERRFEFPVNPEEKSTGILNQNSKLLPLQVVLTNNPELISNYF